MSATARGFDQLAGSYDRLAKLVFGPTLAAAQRQWLQCLPPKGRVLWVGGGTGEWLPELLALHPCVEVIYLELSGEMLRRARQRIPDTSRVQWIHGSLDALPSEARYDAVLTFFFLDLFAPDEFEASMDRLHAHLRPGGQWLFADFVPQTSWQRAILKALYLGFRWLCGISGKDELPFEQAFRRRGYRLRGEQRFWRGMIAAWWWRKGEKFEIRNSTG